MAEQSTQPTRDSQPATRTYRRSIWRVGPDSTWTTILPVAFIIVSLLSLVVLPIVVSRHTQAMRVEITKVAEPSRRHANQIQMDLAAELDAIIGWQVTGQQQYRQRYLELIAREDANTKQLQKLAPRLGDDLTRGLALLQGETRRWHLGVRNGEFLSRQLPKEVFLTRFFEQHPPYEKSLRAASELELDIQTGIESRLQSIREAEQANFWLTIILALLALTSALLVAGLGRQMRLLAREAMARRQEAEREAHEARSARTAAEREERRSAFLAAAGQELTASLDYQHTIATLAKLIVPHLAEMSVIDIAEEEGKLRRAAVAHRHRPVEQQLAKDLGQAISDVPEMVVRIMEAREAKLIGSASTVGPYIGAPSAATHPLLLVPLVSRGQTLGIVGATAPEGRPFNADDVNLFSELARHASLAIDNARLYLESQQAVRAREEVLAIVSHDLRNPLSAVTLGASLLETSDLSDDDREQIETIGLSAKRMERLIADLLDVTRLEGGKRLPIEPAKLDVESLFREGYEIFRAQAAAGEVTLQYNVADRAETVYADRHRVLQVLSNLIGNSLKFTPAGGMISFRAEPTDGKVLFTVADTGPGIPKEHLGDIFSPYWQAKRAERMGAGLGLPIAKGVVESHGGTMWVESEQGAGTKFFFTLPVEEIPDGATTPALSAGSPARR